MVRAYSLPVRDIGYQIVLGLSVGRSANGPCFSLTGTLIFAFNQPLDCPLIGP